MSDNQSQIALEVNDITKVFVTSAGIFEALRGISFVIKRGEFVSIVGPSGSGKSTLLNMIGALDRPTSGKVYIDGIDIFSLRDGEIASMRNKLIGFIFQSFNLINRSTVQKNVELPAIISDMSKQERNRRAFMLLETLGVADKAKFKTSSLSGGQQQRVAIARALINNPTMILADEPTGNLDTATGNEVFALLKNLSSKFRRTIIMVLNLQFEKSIIKAVYAGHVNIPNDPVIRDLVSKYGEDLLKLNPPDQVKPLLETYQAGVLRLFTPLLCKC